MVVSKQLTGHELFRSLRFEDVDRINSFSGLRELRGGEYLFRSGTLGSHVYVMVEGKVSLRLPAHAHEASLAIGVIEKGELFGLAPLLGAGRHLTTARCTQAGQVLSIEAAPLRELIESDPVIGFHIMKMAAQTYFTRYVDSLRRVQRVISDIAVV